jgi:pyruvate,water dikinase
MVRGDADLLLHVRRVWSSFWTERAIHNRALFGRAAESEEGGPDRRVGGGVIVQRIAWSRLSGVAQTVNAAEGKMREIVVNVGLGLGEGIVSGLVGSDLIFASKDSAGPSRSAVARPPGPSGSSGIEELRFRYLVGDKQEKVIFDAAAGKGTVRVPTRYHERFRAALEYSELLELVRALRILEEGCAVPLDVEFGFEGAELKILQARPVASVLRAISDSCARDPLASKPDRWQSPVTAARRKEAR